TSDAEASPRGATVAPPAETSGQKACGTSEGAVSCIAASLTKLSLPCDLVDGRPRDYDRPRLALGRQGKYPEPVGCLHRDRHLLAVGKPDDDWVIGGQLHGSTLL